MSHGGDAAIDEELRAGDELGLVRTQINRRMGYVVGIAKAAEGNLARQLVADLRLISRLSQAIDKRRADKGGMQGVAGDAISLAGAVQGDGFGQMPDRCFGGVIARQIMAGDDAGYRGDIQNRAARARLSRGCRH